MSDRKTQRLRVRLRQRRRAMSAARHKRASARICARIAALFDPRNARGPLMRRGLLTGHVTLAMFFANDAEPDLRALLKPRTKALRWRFALPVIDDTVKGRMQFQAWRPGEPLRHNRFGISEPHADPRRVVPVRELDVVLVPLVGVDDRGHRLGMGGGYYDRALARSRGLHRGVPCVGRPILIGVAFEQQRVRALRVRRWDVPLDGLVTESRRVWFHRA